MTLSLSLGQSVCTSERKGISGSSLSGMLMCVTDTRWHVLIGVSPAVIRGMSLWTCLRQLDSDNGLTVTSRLSRVDWFDWFTSVMCVIDKARTILLCHERRTAAR
jgi:hypothetical protein